MAFFGSLLITLGILGMVASFLLNPLFGAQGITMGFGALVLGCIIMGLDRIHHAVRKGSAAEIEVLKQGFDNMVNAIATAQRLASQPSPSSGALLQPPAPTGPGKCPDCGRSRAWDDVSCLACGSTRPTVSTTA